MYKVMENEAVFLSDDTISETETQELQALTVEDFELTQFVGIGMIAGGSAILISLMVLGLLSILRTR